MGFLVIAYPALDESDFEKIQEFRKHKDALYFTVIEPHFTFVFAENNIPKDNFIAEAQKRLTGIEKIDFTIRGATLHKDELSDYFNVFLVLGEGYSDMIKLHDALHKDLFRMNHRQDIEYTPHITIGNSTNKQTCQTMVDEWNKQEIEIKGSISHVTIIEYKNRVATNLQKIELY